MKCKCLKSELPDFAKASSIDIVAVHDNAVMLTKSWRRMPVEKLTAKQASLQQHRTDHPRL